VVHGQNTQDFETTMSKRHVVAFSYRVAARGAAAILQAVSFVILARQLGADGLGAVAVGLSVGTIVSILTGFGGATRALRLGLETEHKRVATAMFAAQCPAAFISGAVSCVVVTGLLDREWWLGVAVGIMVLSDALCGLEQAVLAGLFRPFASAGLLLFQRAVPFTCLALTHFVGVPAILGYTVGAGIAAAAAIVRPIRDWHRPIKLGELIFSSRGYWSSKVAESLGMLDIVVVRLFAGGSAVGLYSIANRVANPFHIIATSISSIITPAAAHAQRREETTEILRRSTTISVICGVVISACSPLFAEIAVKMLGTEFAPAKKLIIGFIIAVAISGVSQTIVARYLIEGLPSLVAMSITLGIGIGLLLTMVVATHLSTWLWICPILMQLTIMGLLVLNRQPMSWPRRLFAKASGF
jgi:O-antigen/teichoic acid export membrane protein